MISFPTSEKMDYLIDTFEKLYTKDQDKAVNFARNNSDRFPSYSIDIVDFLLGVKGGKDVIRHLFRLNLIEYDYLPEHMQRMVAREYHSSNDTSAPYITKDSNIMIIGRRGDDAERNAIINQLIQMHKK